MIIAVIYYYYLFFYWLVTGRGPAEALPFGLKLIEILNGLSRAEEIKKSLL